MKKLFTISIIFVICMLWIVLYPNYTFATVQNDPTTTNDSNYQVIEQFKSYDSLLANILGKDTTSNRSALLSQFAIGRSYVYFLDNTTSGKIYLAVYNQATPILGGYTINIYNNNNSIVMVDGYKIDTVHTFRIDLNYGGNASVTVVNNNEQIYVPAVTYNYFGDQILQCLKDTGYISSDSSLADVTSGLAAINNSVVSEGNQTQQAIGSMQNATTGAIGDMSNSVTNSIAQQQQQQQNNFNQFTNTNYYDNTVTTIDVQDIYGNVNDTGVDTFLFSVYDKLTDGFSTRTRSTIITIPMPFNMDPLVLDSTPIVNFYDTIMFTTGVGGHGATGVTFGSFLYMFWYFVFGIYYVRFAKRIFTWVVSGQVLNVNGFMKQLNDFNANITKEMM